SFLCLFARVTPIGEPAGFIRRAQVHDRAARPPDPPAPTRAAPGAGRAPGAARPRRDRVQLVRRTRVRAAGGWPGRGGPRPGPRRAARGEASRCASGAGRGPGGTRPPGGAARARRWPGRSWRPPRPQTSGQGDLGQDVSRASRTLRWVGMQARVHTYVEEACTVVNTGREEAFAIL